MSEFTRVLKDRTEERGFSVDDHLLAQLNVYRQMLIDWNEMTNLTSVTDDPGIIDKHFIDSMLLVRYEPLRDGIKIADVGTGAGFPGLPIKMYRPEIRLTLLESIGKKTAFLQAVVDRLGLENVDIVNERSEIAAQSPEYREQYDLVVARAVARLPVLAECCLPLVSVGGKFVAYKGSEAELEVTEAENALELLGGRLERIERDVAENPDASEDARALVFILKVRQTPEKYPRRPGMARKRPL